MEGLQVLTTLAVRSLEECEAVIERGMASFIEVGNTLLEIRDHRFYLATHNSFNNYCLERWGWGRHYAYRLIASGEVITSMTPILEQMPPLGRGEMLVNTPEAEVVTIVNTLPSNEAQAHALAPLKDQPEKMVEAWQEAVTETGGKPTAKAVAEAVAKRTEPGEQKNPAMLTSDSDDWHTPPGIVTRVLQTFDGRIDLDPCSNLGQPNVPAAEHYTLEDDGLSKVWAGQVYMNPPYGDALAKWIEKLVQSFVDGEIDSAIALVPARTDTRWFRTLRIYPRCFIFGRLKFSGSGNSAPFPSMAVYLGPDERKFIDAFSPIGDVFGVIE